jgi:hypothetical protein
MFQKGQLSNPGLFGLSTLVSRKGTETKVDLFENGLYDEF